MRQAVVALTGVQECIRPFDDQHADFDPELNGSKILIVDDTRTNIDVLIQALGGEFELAVALDGFKALQYLTDNAVDLVLLDIMMPGMSGYEVCHKIKNNPDTRDIPVIFITAVNSVGGLKEGFQAGAVDYITKPFETLEVIMRVKNHLYLKLAKQTIADQNKILEEKVKDRTEKLEEAQLEILERLALAAEYRDNETGQHIRRIKEFCMLLARAVGLSVEDSTDLALASTMHDVGKIGIPDRILLKPGKLTEEELASMRKHSEIGSDILGNSKSYLLQLAEIISLTHHERWDGRGYPKGLKGEQIPLAGRIVCICDVFDALITKRVYKDAWSFEDAMAEIRSCSGSQFDPRLVQLFSNRQQALKNIITRLGLQ